MDRIQRLSRMLIAATKQAGGELTLTAEELDVDGFAIRFDQQDDGSTKLKVITHDEAIALGQAQRRLQRNVGPGPGREGTFESGL